MPNRDVNRQIEGLKTIKSAFLIEARALADAGLAAASWPFYRRAAELECELADVCRPTITSCSAAIL